MRNCIAALFLNLSSFFFKGAVNLHKEVRHSLDFRDLTAFQKCTFGIFIEAVEENGKVFGLFANSHIGFFYKENVFTEEVIGFPYPTLATKYELDDIKKYLIDKIFECHGQIEKLDKDEIQRSLSHEQTI